MYTYSYAHMSRPRSSKHSQNAFYCSTTSFEIEDMFRVMFSKIHEFIYKFFSFRFLTVFALLEWNLCCADFRFFHSGNPRFFIPYTQPPRAESIFWREQHYVCLSLIFPHCNIWSKTQSMQFSTPSFQDIIMANKCCHVKVCDSHILGIAGKAFDSFQF